MSNRLRRPMAVAAVAAVRQVHAVLSWLVVQAAAPNDVHLHLVDALLAWAALMGDHLFPTEPELAWTGTSTRC